MKKHFRTIIAITVLGIILFIFWFYFLTTGLEESVLKENGYKITSQSQEITFKYKVMPSLLPKKDGEIIKLHQEIYNNHNTLIFLKKIGNLKGNQVALSFVIVPTFQKQGGEIVLNRVIHEENGLISESYVDPRPLFVNEMGKEVEISSGVSRGPGNKFGLIIDIKDIKDNEGLNITFKEFNLIKYIKEDF